jgi:hypothetical protein
MARPARYSGGEPPERLRGVRMMSGEVVEVVE